MMFIKDLKSGKLPKEYLDSLDRKEIKEVLKKEVTLKKKGEARKLIDSSLKISDVAKKYGLKVKANKIICPFHNDSDPSLSLNDKLNVYHCFGCNISGDIIDFVRRLEEWKEKKQ